METEKGMVNKEESTYGIQDKFKRPTCVLTEIWKEKEGEWEQSNIETENGQGWLKDISPLI